MIDLEDFPLIRNFAEKARAEARAKGLAEGLAEGRVGDLTKIIEIRFGTTGLQELEEQIRAIQDEQKLFALIKPALTSTSLDAFKNALAEI